MKDNENVTHAAAVGYDAGASPTPVARGPRRGRVFGPRNRRVFAALAFLIMILFVLVMPSSFIVQQAGPAIDVSSEIDGTPIVEVEGTKTYPSQTNLMMTTVSAFGNPETGAPVAKVLGALFSKDEQVTPVRALYPQTITAEELNTQNTALMDNSQDTAAAVAFDMAGMDVSMTLRVVGTNPQLSAGKVIEKQDVILGITAPATDGQYLRVDTFRDLSSVLDETKPGTEIALKLLRGEEEIDVTVTTQAYEPDLSGWVNPGSLLGVLIEVQDLKLPAEANYVVEGIGGPSAGSIFSMEIFDQITPDSLGGDATIAGTGSMAWDGDVGPIGGIVHKLVGAKRAGATDFLAPAANCAETRGYIPEGLNVWAVRTADDAREAIEAIGAGDTSGLETCEAAVATQGITASN